MDRTRLLTAVEYMERNFGNRHLTVSDVARAAGLSVFHFSREFKIAMGKTPHAYLTQVRLLAAKRLLAHGCRSIESIAITCGYATHPHFTNVFGRGQGCSPAKYRQLARAGAVSA